MGEAQVERFYGISGGSTDHARRRYAKQLAADMDANRRFGDLVDGRRGLTRLRLRRGLVSLRPVATLFALRHRALRRRDRLDAGWFRFLFGHGVLLLVDCKTAIDDKRDKPGQTRPQCHVHPFCQVTHDFGVFADGATCHVDQHADGFGSGIGRSVINLVCHKIVIFDTPVIFDASLQHSGYDQHDGQGGEKPKGVKPYALAVDAADMQRKSDKQEIDPHDSAHVCKLVRHRDAQNSIESTPFCIEVKLEVVGVIFGFFQGSGQTKFSGIHLDSLSVLTSLWVLHFDYTKGSPVRFASRKKEKDETWAK